MRKKLLPRHIGFIPDGNRRWAQERNLPKEAGYSHGVDPGLRLCELCESLGIEEVSIYGFTQDNTKRPSVQTQQFRAACVAFAQALSRREVALEVIGDTASSQFPPELKRFEQRRGAGMKVNLLVNYGWEWDLAGLRTGTLHSADASRIDLVVRWGGGRRLSGFLPVQSVYADIYVVDAFWPDYTDDHLRQALSWFRQQDRTFGG